MKNINKLLPICLGDIGLEKKRYSDGNYWYGLIPKSDNIINSISVNYSNVYLQRNNLNDKSTTL